MSEPLKEQGLQLFRSGAYQEALSTFEAAAAAYESAGNRFGQAEMLNNIGVVQRFLRNYPAGVQALDQARALFAAANDPDREAQAIGNMADLLRVQGKKEAAASAYGDAAARFAAAGEPGRQADVLRALSLLRLRQRRWLEAIVVMEQSLSVRPRPSLGQRLLRALMRLGKRMILGGAGA